MRKITLLVLIITAALATQAQSIWKPLPVYHKKLGVVVSPADSLPNISQGKFQGFRLAGPDILFAIPDFSVYTGLGIDYVWASANTTTGKWVYNTTIGPRILGGANLGVPTVQTIGAVGIRATFFNGWLAVAGIYNLTLKHAQAAIGNPAAMIPGLN